MVETSVIAFESLFIVLMNERSILRELRSPLLRSSYSRGWCLLVGKSVYRLRETTGKQCKQDLGHGARRLLREELAIAFVLSLCSANQPRKPMTTVGART
jgi:hypothetical protein